MSKVLILGIDAMDPKIFDKLKDEMPNFSKLEFRPLQTTIPPETPVAWSAASTGCNPGRYGIYDFLNRNLETYTPKLNLANEKRGILKTEYECAMRGTPFWRTLSEKGIDVSVIRWPVTFPPEKIKGRMFSGLGVVDIKGMLNSYTFYTDGKEEEDKVINVLFKDDKAESYVSGPIMIKKGERRDIRSIMDIERKKGACTIRFEGDEIELKKGEWSSIVRVKFKVMRFIEMTGIVQFYLESTKPFRMYMTSVMIDPSNQSVPITSPKEYGKELVDSIGQFYTLGMAEDTKAVTEDKLAIEPYLEQVRMIEEQRTKMFWHEFNNWNKGVLAFVFDAGDRLNHICWTNKVLEKSRGPGKQSSDSKSDLDIPDEIRQYYFEKDKLLGEIMSKLDKDDKIIVMSDHGFNSFEREVNVNKWLVDNGYLSAEKEEGDLFSFVDWSKTKAYSLGFTSVFINQKGRESQGIVAVEEKDKLIDEMVEKMKAFKDGKTPVFTNVYKGREIYKGDQVHLAPDIVVGFNQGYRMSWKSAVGSLDKSSVFKNESMWKGDHLIDRSHVPGVLFTNFKLKDHNPQIIDVVPTLYKLLGIESDVDGEALI